MSNIKTIHEFTVSNKNGKKFNFFLKELSRRERDELAKFYKIRFNTAQKEGFLTKNMIVANAEAHSNGLLPREKARRMEELRFQMSKLQQDLVETEIEHKDDLTKAEEKKKPIFDKFLVLQKELIELETYYQSSFDNSAESEAQSAAVVWAMLFLTFFKAEEDPGDPKPYFSGNTYEEKRENDYNKYDAEDELHGIVRDRLFTYFALYVSGGYNKEQFKAIEARLNSEKSEKTDSVTETVTEEKVKFSTETNSN